MNKKIRISIGIPAYNEEKKITHLLTSLLKQKEKGFVLQKIIVALDGSTDHTQQRIEAISDPRISIISGKKRKGKSARLNDIFRRFHSDALVLLDADVTITDPLLLAKVVKGSTITTDGIVAINAMPLPAESFVEKSLEVGVKIMKDIAMKWNDGRNYLSFKGCFLFLDKKFTKQLTLSPTLVNNDAFLFFSALTKGYTTRYLSDVFIYYQSPCTFRDHLKQAARYHTSEDELIPHFGNSIQKNYQLPLTISLQSMVKYFFLNPIYCISYLGIKVVTKLIGERRITSTWSIAHSTK